MLLSLFDSSYFFEARAEILKKIVGILVEMLTPERNFEINWSLEKNLQIKYPPFLFFNRKKTYPWMISWSMIYKILFVLQFTIALWATKIIKFINGSNIPRIIWIFHICQFQCVVHNDNMSVKMKNKTEL